VSCLFLPRLGDIYGRKPIYIFALLLQIAVYILACRVSTLKGIYVVAAFLGPCVIGRMACGFLLLMELVPKRYQTWVGTALMVTEGASQIIWTIYFVTISKNAFYFVYFTVGLNVIAAVGAFYIVESPRYLYGMEKFDQCRTVLNTIARRNNI
jgi:MFS family permease